ncbi:hypothetical protein [Vibrio coralliilyticus]|uniref:hypothetical protein n=1 Tax=Vibrio coralliilyticus TaxID=190893 RepID=UPI001C10504F|nr:hypothetical protein [Vibrio coralliilyticus]WFB49902.1 hypothetical protein P6988_23975 [Vibrio coralliilyticus]
MSTLQAIPTQHGIDILNSELKNTVTKYRLIGALTHDAPSESLTSFYENTIETSYYDENGVLTFILNLPIEQHFDEYLHKIHVLDSSNQSVIECSTPKVALPKGIGGMVTLKAAISGEAGQVIFKHGEFVTEAELNEVHLPTIFNLINQWDLDLSKLPIYPEVLNESGQLSIALAGTTLTIPDNQTIRMFGWKDFNTSDFQTKSLEIDLAKIYHLRFTEANGLELKDLSDLVYNPTSKAETDVSFDSSYDNVLLAVIDSGSITALINKSVLYASNETEGANANNVFPERELLINWARTPINSSGVVIGIHAQSYEAFSDWSVNSRIDSVVSFDVLLVSLDRYKCRHKYRAQDDNASWTGGELGVRFKQEVRA